MARLRLRVLAARDGGSADRFSIRADGIGTPYETANRNRRKSTRYRSASRAWLEGAGNRARREIWLSGNSARRLSLPLAQARMLVRASCASDHGVLCYVAAARTRTRGRALFT